MLLDRLFFTNLFSPMVTQWQRDRSHKRAASVVKSSTNRQSRISRRAKVLGLLYPELRAKTRRRG
jgi:hypothetical protein